VANVGDRVTFSLSWVSGLPTEVDRDFGNGKTFKCNLSNQGRSTCLQVTEVYTTPGTYTIRAEVTSADQPTIDGSINLKIQ
jgi:PKD repeat protein